jgi:hypothetical protein
MLANASSMVQHWQESITAAATSMHTYHLFIYLLIYILFYFAATNMHSYHFFVK